MLDCRKEDFFLPEGRHYLNCAYMAPMARVVEEAGIEGIRRKRDPATIEPLDFFETGDAIRASFARLVGVGEPDRVALVPAASYGLSVAARNLPIEAGQHIVTLKEQFPSNVYTWTRLAAEREALVVCVEPAEGPQRGRRWNERLLEAINRKTAVVALPGVHWADGTVFDLEAVGQRCREVGAALVVDGTQSVGAFPFDVSRVQPDALVCPGYKWLLGPYSFGMAYFGPRFDGGVPLEENWIARRDSHDFAGLVRYREEYGRGATRYDVGERSNFVLAPMMLAALRMLEEWTVPAISRYCAGLADPIVTAARELGYGVEEDDLRAPHLFGLRMPPGLAPEVLRDELARRRVSVSIRGDAVRVSPNVYNDAADVAALIEGLEVHRGASA